MLTSTSYIYNQNENNTTRNEKKQTKNKQPKNKQTKKKYKKATITIPKIQEIETFIILKQQNWVSFSLLVKMFVSATTPTPLLYIKPNAVLVSVEMLKKKKLFQV